MDNLAEREDGWGAFVHPEVILPEQFFGALRRQRPRQGEQRLMLAMLEDALRCFQNHLFARRSRERRLFWDAEQWLLGEDQAPFSFEHVCAVLEIDPAYLRERLQRWAARQHAQRTCARMAVSARTAPTRVAPAASRSGAPCARRGARRPACGAATTPAGASEATESTPAYGLSYVPGRPERVYAERTDVGAAPTERQRSA
ncbi:MAG: hypothetical protein U0587_17955 [Candidatus Binatia bacterium]